MDSFESLGTKGTVERSGEPINHIGMISHHGYFAADPQLGKVDTGGQVVFVLELSKYLHNFCHANITIFTRYFEEEGEPIHAQAKEPVCEGVNIIRIPDSMSAKGFIRKEDLYPYLPETAENIVKWIKKKGKIDVIHSHYVDGGILGGMVSKRLNLPWVHNSHSLGKVKKDALMRNVTDDKEISNLDQEFNFELRFKNEEMIYDNCLLIFAESLDEKTNLLKYYGQKYDNKVMVIPPGINTVEWHPKSVDKNTHPLNYLFSVQDNDYIFSVSRIDPRKGLDLLIEAAPLIISKVKQKNLKIVIGGGTKKGKKMKPYEEKLHQLAKKIDPKQEFLYLTGYIPDEDILDYFNGCEVFVLPARWELFGITMLEAMACEKPVVVTKFGGPSTIIESGKNGILVDPTNKEELATKIVELLDEKEKAKMIAKNAYKTITLKFSWQRIAEEYYVNYLKVVNAAHK